MTDSKKKECIISNGLYQEEIDSFYELPKEKQKELIEATEKQIEELEPNEKEIAKKLGSLFLAIVYQSDLLEDPINEGNINKIYEDRIEWIEQAERFFKREDSEELYKKYGVLDTYANGELKIDDYLLETIFRESGFTIREDKEKFKEIIKNVLKDEDKLKFPSEEVLKENSIKQNGIGFKEFLFCEEYIKQGRITKVAKQLGIGRTTCYDYLKKDEVKQYLTDRRKEIKNESDNLLKSGFFDCFQELHSLITDKSYIQDSDKIRAIDTYLRHYETSINKENTSSNE